MIQAQTTLSLIRLGSIKLEHMCIFIYASCWIHITMSNWVLFQVSSELNVPNIVIEFQAKI